MFTKCLSIVLAFSLVLVLTAQPAGAQTNESAKAQFDEKVETERNSVTPVSPKEPSKEAKYIAKVKAGVAKLGTGPDARVEVNLRDKTKLKGYISEVTEDHFVVTDAKNGTSTVVPYPKVKQVKGNNLSKGVKIAIVVAIVVVVVGLLGLLFGGD